MPDLITLASRAFPSAVLSARGEELLDDARF